MPKLSATLIDVGWGDSILIESVDGHNAKHYALIDSNDSTYYKSSFIYLKKYFEKKQIDIESNKPIFSFVMLSHFHTDHGQGLKKTIQYFGTDNLYYPKSDNPGRLSYLINFARRSSNVRHHQAVDTTKIFSNLGDTEVEALWPRHNEISTENENNNSIVLHLKLRDRSFLLTGDAEEEVWDQIAGSIPESTSFFKVPHHGSRNGTFDRYWHPVWLNDCPNEACLGISAHIEPHDHPHPRVISLFESAGCRTFRTDQHYHVTISTDGHNLEVKYSTEEEII